MREDAAGEILNGAHDHLRMPGSVRIDGTDYEVEVNIAGASTLHETKKSLHLRFRGDGWKGYDEFRLSTAVRDRSMIRSFLAQDIFAAAGVMSPEVEPVFVSLNERILGVYVGTEVVDKKFFRRRGLRVSRWYETVGGADFGRDFSARITEMYKSHPDDGSLERIQELHRILDLEDDAEFESRIFERLDRESTLGYLAAGKVLNHYDGFNKNLNLAETGPDRKLKPAAWDFDFTWMPKMSNRPVPWEINHLFLRISQLPSVAAEVEARVARLLAGAGSEAALRPRMAEWREKLRAAYNADPYLGRSNYSIDEESEKLMADIAAWYRIIR